MNSPGNAEPQLGNKTDPKTAELELGKKGDPNTAELGLSVPGWHSRGYLPHFDRPGMVQSVTFRLADSLPQSLLADLEVELRGTATKLAGAERRKKIERWLDSGIGCCALAHPKLAELMQETLLKWDGDRYRLLAWCVMPNHVHALLETMATLAKIVQSWKSYTGRWAMRMNAELGLGIPGDALWMRDYWDRFIRDETHFRNVLSYIEANPVTAKLCKQKEHWRWSSAAAVA
jgi:putative transposase